MSHGWPIRGLFLVIVEEVFPLFHQGCVEVQWMNHKGNVRLLDCRIIRHALVLQSNIRLGFANVDIGRFVNPALVDWEPILFFVLVDQC
jgi:hypothetical protein